MKFCINDYVKVKLTDFGKECMKQNHEKLWQCRDELYEFKLPEEDKDGWSKWQGWILMQEFGPHISLGGKVPFETIIEIVEG